MRDHLAISRLSNCIVYIASLVGLLVGRFTNIETTHQALLFAIFKPFNANKSYGAS